MTTRQRFALWAMRSGYSIETDKTGRYLHPSSADAWEGFRAGWVTRAAQPGTDDLGIAYSLGRADERESQTKSIPEIFPGVNAALAGLTIKV